MKLQEEASDIVEIPEPDRLPASQRHVEREKCEDMKFDAEYYLADFFENESIVELVNFEAPWTREKISGSEFAFTEEEKQILRELPNRTYLIDSDQSLLLSLVDIVFAFAYDYRTTLGEHTVESGWTIARLSSTLSWLCVCFSTASYFSPPMLRNFSSLNM